MIHAEAEFFGTSSTTGSKAFLSRLAAGLRIRNWTLQGIAGNYGAFSHDVTTAILVFQNNEIAALLVFHTNPVGDEPFSYVKNFFYSNKFA